MAKLSPPKRSSTDQATSPPASTNEFRKTLNSPSQGFLPLSQVEALSARGYCVSAGSACHSTSAKPSETLTQMKVGRDRAMSAIRVSFGTRTPRVKSRASARA